MNILKIVYAIILAIISNQMVNISDNLYLGLRYPEIYLPIVVSGIILSFGLQVIGSYIIIEKTANIKKRIKLVVQKKPII